MKRRTFITRILGGLAALALPARDLIAGIVVRYLRPPGALPEKQFIAQCIGCTLCAQVCPNRCIKFFSPSNHISKSNTPYIIAREKPCILCMKCGKICPTGALNPIKRTAKDIIENVQMGKARVDKTLCLSYQGKTCGVCYRACPLQDVAIKVGMLEQPQVLDACVGCGLCERSCIQIPQAITIIPNEYLTRGHSKS